MDRRGLKSNDHFSQRVLCVICILNHKSFEKIDSMKSCHIQHSNERTISDKETPAINLITLCNQWKNLINLCPIECEKEAWCA